MRTNRCTGRSRLLLGLLLAVTTGPLVPSTVQVAAAAPAACAQVSFGQPHSYDQAGRNPQTVVVADFNGDGRADLAVTDGASKDFDFQNSVISILNGRGDGTFAPAISVPAAAQPSALLTADLNDDGRPDLIVGNSLAERISVLLGLGNGDFLDSGSYFVPSYFGGTAALGDLNRDGRLDIVVNSVPDFMAVLLGNGDGTFQSVRFIEFAAGPNEFVGSPVLEDFNHDGRIDLAVRTTDSILVALGHGDATFDREVRYAIGHFPFQIAAADANSDGVLDLIALIDDATTGGSKLVVFAGIGDGSFAPPIASPSVSELGRQFAVGDLDGDGRVDLLVAQAGPLVVQVLRGVGDGTFRFADEFSTPASVGSATLGDLNADGRLDVAVTTFGAELPDQVTVLLNTCAAPAHQDQASLGLDGHTSFASASRSDLNLLSDRTIELWFKDVSAPVIHNGVQVTFLAGEGYNHDYETLINKGDRATSGESPYFISIGFKRVVAGVRTAWTDTTLSYDLFAHRVAANEWHHVAFTVNGSRRTATLYFDGVAVQQDRVPVSSGNNLPLQIGRNGPASGKYFQGKIDDVRVWNVVRSAAEIKANFATELVSPQPGLIANWRFNRDANDAVGGPLAGLAGAAFFSTDIHP